MLLKRPLTLSLSKNLKKSHQQLNHINLTHLSGQQRVAKCDFLTLHVWPDFRPGLKGFQGYLGYTYYNYRYLTDSFEFRDRVLLGKQKTYKAQCSIQKLQIISSVITVLLVLLSCLPFEPKTFLPSDFRFILPSSPFRSSPNSLKTYKQPKKKQRCS